MKNDSEFKTCQPIESHIHHIRTYCVPFCDNKLVWCQLKILTISRNAIRAQSTIGVLNCNREKFTYCICNMHDWIDCYVDLGTHQTMCLHSIVDGLLLSIIKKRLTRNPWTQTLQNSRLDVWHTIWTSHAHMLTCSPLQISTCFMRAHVNPLSIRLRMPNSNPQSMSPVYWGTSAGFASLPNVSCII